MEKPEKERAVTREGFVCVRGEQDERAVVLPPVDTIAKEVLGDKVDVGRLSLGPLLGGVCRAADQEGVGAEHDAFLDTVAREAFGGRGEALVLRSMPKG